LRSILQPSRIILLFGDLVALILFVYIGQRDHELLNHENPFLGILATTIEFALPWLIAAILLNAYPRTNRMSVRTVLGNAMVSWLVAAPLGLLLRAYILNRAIIPTSFFAATLFFGGLFIFIWRLVYIVIYRISQNTLTQSSKEQ
jgi:hypothetical protein